MDHDPIEVRERHNWGIAATAVVVIAVVAAGLAIWGWRATEDAREAAFIAPNTTENPTPIPQAGRDLAADAPVQTAPGAIPTAPAPAIAAPAPIPPARGDAAAADAVVGTPTGAREAPPADVTPPTNVGATAETRRLENTGDVTAAIAGGQEATVKGTVAAFNAAARTLTLDNGNTYVLADNLQIGQGDLTANVLQVGNDVQLTYRTDADARLVISVTDLPDPAAPAIGTGANVPAVPAP